MPINICSDAKPGKSASIVGAASQDRVKGRLRAISRAHLPLPRQRAGSCYLLTVEREFEARLYSHDIGC